MSELLQKKYSIDICQKLYEKNTLDGALAVYQTTRFGTIFTINEEIVISEHDGFFYHEMISHPALFTHPSPKKIAVIGHCYGILQEVLKHTTVSEVWCITENDAADEIISQYFSDLYATRNDHRVRYHFLSPAQWLDECGQASFDIIIQGLPAHGFLQEHYHKYFHALGEKGILVQSCQTALLHMDTLKPVFHNIQQAGFDDWQTLNFPQPSYPAGWRTVIMAIKHMPERRIREKDIYNRTFKTRYYNYDTHKAALALPEFMREAWLINE
jgi:spermidine synthase